MNIIFQLQTNDDGIIRDAVLKDMTLRIADHKPVTVNIHGEELTGTLLGVFPKERDREGHEQIWVSVWIPDEHDNKATVKHLRNLLTAEADVSMSTNPTPLNQ